MYEKPFLPCKKYFFMLKQLFYKKLVATKCWFCPSLHQCFGNKQVGKIFLKSKIDNVRVSILVHTSCSSLLQCETMVPNQQSVFFTQMLMENLNENNSHFSSNCTQETKVQNKFMQIKLFHDFCGSKYQVAQQLVFALIHSSIICGVVLSKDS